MLTRLTPPTTPPLSLEMLKSYLKLDCADDDALLITLQKAAVDYLETHLGISFSQQDYRLTLCEAPRVLAFSVGPLIAVTSVSCQDETGAYVPLDPSLYRVCDQRIIFANLEKNIEVLFIAGFTTPPELLLLAIQLLVGHWYENRIDLGDTALPPLPPMLPSLLSGFRKVRLI